jgi:hypothetical protein
MSRFLPCPVCGSAASLAVTTYDAPVGAGGRRTQTFYCRRCGHLWDALRGRPRCDPDRRPDRPAAAARPLPP